MRSGEVDIYPGHDGEYGTISVFSSEERERLQGRWYRRRPVRCWHWPGAGIARLVECAVAITSEIYVPKYVLARTYN